MRASVLYLFAVGAALAQPETDVLLRLNFEAGTSGWTTMGQGGNLRTAGGSLEFSYEVKPGQFAVAVRPAPPETAKLGRLRLRLKTDHDTALAVLLSEKKPGGGNYVATFWSPANSWQTVELAPADFSASDGPGDPVDADGKLDLGEVEGIGILDLAQFFASQPENPGVPLIVNRATGPHVLQVAQFEMLSGAGGRTRPALAIDRFDRGYLQWITMGGMKLKLAAVDNPLHEDALQAMYPQVQGRIAVLLRPLSNLDLSRSAGLSFDVASKTDATLVVSLELKNGRRFNQTIYPPGEGEVFHVKLSFGDFEGEGKIDPAQLKSMSLADVTAAEGGGAENILWIGKLEAVAR